VSAVGAALALLAAAGCASILGIEELSGDGLGSGGGASTASASASSTQDGATTSASSSSSGGDGGATSSGDASGGGGAGGDATGGGGGGGEGGGTPCGFPTCPEALNTFGLQQADAIAVDANHVYFAMTAVATIARVSRDGGAFEMVAEQQQGPGGVATNGSNVVWTTQDAVRRKPVDAIRDVAKDIAIDRPVPTVAALLGDDVFWIETDGPDGGEIWRSSLDAPAPAHVWGNQTAPSAIAVDAEALYWADAGLGQKQSGIVRLPFPDGPAEPIPTEGLDFVVDIALFDEDRIVWVERGLGVDDGRVAAAPRTGGDPEPIAEGEAIPIAIAANEEGIFWIASGDRTIRAADVDGSNVRTIAALGVDLRDLAVSGTDLFFTTAGDVYRLKLEEP
jgi:hypothetical protein